MDKKLCLHQIFNIVIDPDTLRHHPDIIHTTPDNFQTSPESGAHSKSLHALKGTGRKGKLRILGFNVISHRFLLWWTSKDTNQTPPVITQTHSDEGILQNKAFWKKSMFDYHELIWMFKNLYLVKILGYCFFSNSALSCIQTLCWRCLGGVRGVTVPGLCLVRSGEVNPFAKIILYHDAHILPFLS